MISIELYSRGRHDPMFQPISSNVARTYLEKRWKLANASDASISASNVGSALEWGEIYRPRRRPTIRKRRERPIAEFVTYTFILVRIHVGEVRHFLLCVPRNRNSSRLDCAVTQVVSAAACGSMASRRRMWCRYPFCYVARALAHLHLQLESPQAFLERQDGQCRLSLPAPLLGELHLIPRDKIVGKGRHGC